MGFKPTRAALCLCVAAVCVSGVSSSITEPSKDRVLQGSYTPAQDSDEQIYCSAAGLSFSSLVLPEASLPDLRLKLENPLTGVATQFIDLILSAELRGQIGVRAPKLIMSVPVIGWSIFIVCLIVFLLLALCVAWCLGCFKGPKAPEGTPDVNARVGDLGGGGGGANIELSQMPKPQMQGVNGQPLGIVSDDEEEQRNRAEDLEIKNRRSVEDSEMLRAEAERKRLREWQKGTQLNTEEEYQLEQENSRAKQQLQRRRDEEDRQKRAQREERKSKKSKNQPEQKNEDRKNDSVESDEGISTKQVDLKKYLKIQKIFEYSTYGAGLGALGLTIGWLVYLAGAVTSIKTIACGAAGFKRISIQGDISGPYKFGGVNGLKLITTSALSLATKLPAVSVSANLANINARNFLTLAPRVWSDFNGLDTNLENYKYLGLDFNAAVTPPSIRTYIQTTLPGSLKAEVQFLTTLGLNLGRAGVVLGKVPTIDMSMVNNFNTALDLSIGALGPNFLKIFTTTVPNYFGIFKDFGYTFLILGSILIFFSLIIAAYVLYYLSKLLAVFRSDDEKQKDKDGEYDKLDDKLNQDPENPDPNQQRQVGSRYGDTQGRDAPNQQSRNNPGDRQYNQNTNPTQNRPADQTAGNKDHQKKQDRLNESQENVLSGDKKNTYNSSQQNKTTTKDGPQLPSFLKCCGCLVKIFTLGGMKVCQLVMALGIVLLALVMLAFAMASFVGSIAVTTGCLISHNTLTQADFALRLVNSGLLNKQASTFVSECVALNGTGDIQKVMDVSSNDLFDLINGVGGLAAFETKRSSWFENTSVSEPPVGASLNTQWANLAQLKVSDTDGNSNDVESGRSQINNNRCSQDTIVYNNGGCSSSSPTDTDTQGLGSAFCFNLNSFQSKGYPSRYNSGVTCAGNPNTQSAQSTLTSTLTAAARYKNVMGKLQAGFSTPFYTGTQGTQGEKGLFSGLKSVSNDVSALINEPNIKSFVNLQASFGGGLEASGNCTLLRTAILATQNAVCDKVYTQLYSQSKFSFPTAVTLLTTALTIFGSCFYTTKIEMLTSLA